MDVEFDFEKRYRLVREIIETIVLTVLMFLIIRMAVQNFNIDGHSMEPNFHDKELVLVDKWSYLFRPPARGDVVVFVAPPEPDKDYIKRVIGLPGDIITVRDTNIYVNGKLLKETFISPQLNGLTGDAFTNRVVPADTYFVLGDNRGNSSDSRTWGCLPKQNIIGRAALVYWLFGQDNMGLVPVVNSVFDGVPPPPVIKALDKCPVDNHYHPQQGSTASPSSSTGGINIDMVLLLVLPGVFVARPAKKLWHRQNQKQG